MLYRIKKYKKRKALLSQFDDEYNLNSSYFPGLTKGEIKNGFQKIINYIIDISYKKISLEFTSDLSFFFDIFIKDIYKAHIEIYLDDIKNDSNETFVNIFKNKRFVFSGYGKLRDIVMEINYFCKKN